MDEKRLGSLRLMAAAVDDVAVRTPFLGGSGNCVYCAGGPVYVSGSSYRGVSDDDARARTGIVVRVACVGRALVGFVPDLFLGAST